MKFYDVFSKNMYRMGTFFRWSATARRLFHTFRFGALDAYKNTSERGVFIEDIVRMKAAEPGGVDLHGAHSTIS